MTVYVKDDLADVAELDPAERGTYWSLQRALWLARGTLPFDPQRLARLAGADVARFAEIWAAIACRFEVTDAQIKHPGVTAALEKALSLRDARRAIAARGVEGQRRKRRETSGSTDGLADGLTSRSTERATHASPRVAPAADQPSPSPSPTPTPSPNADPSASTNTEPLSPPEDGGARRGVDTAHDFERFWSAYPKPVKRSEAWKEWQHMRPPIESVLSALEWQVKSVDWRKEDGRFVPAPAKYLSARRWEDEPPRGSRETRTSTATARRPAAIGSAPAEANHPIGPQELPIT